MCGGALDVYSVLPQAPALDLGWRAGYREEVSFGLTQH